MTVRQWAEDTMLPGLRIDEQRPRVQITGLQTHPHIRPAQ